MEFDPDNITPIATLLGYCQGLITVDKKASTSIFEPPFQWALKRHRVVKRLLDREDVDIEFQDDVD
ncbi:hypothetical protein L873DRAFT_1803318 [Choiromyces venosus 120613-1]|uniref:Uncharacterized protein n=1 Tax=Choiromyces venosus 120613-1 TaxID=1336337 RepID=A0A3N4JXM0_9PEZI|nr:hypothetical protein L873DRAFT_1803318 [Choiromyces venosus 120613-1]